MLLVMRTKLPISLWTLAILHATILIRIRLSAYHKYSSLQLVFGQKLNIFHLRIIDCVVYILIAPSQCTKMSSKED